MGIIRYKNNLFLSQMVHQEDSALFLSHVKIRTMIVQTISANVILGIMTVMEYALKVIYIKFMNILPMKSYLYQIRKITLQCAYTQLVF